MSYPTKYARQYDFLSYQNANPTRPLPGDKVNADLNEVVSSIGEIVDFLKTAIRADGQIANQTVGRDQLSADILTLIDAANGNAIAASSVTYDPTSSGLASTTVQDAIDEVVSASGAISSVFGRTGAITAAASDYDASQIDNDSGVSGSTVADALDALAAAAQPLDATLTALAAVVTAADKLIYATGSDTFATADFTSFGRSLVDDADAAAARTTLGLVIGTNVQAYDADLTTWAGLTPSANAQSLVTAADYAAMRALLDLEAGTDFYSKTAADAAFQPVDSDLTAIAALSTTAAGRSVLTIADPNADRVVAWDDSVGAMVAIALTDLTAEAAPASGDYILIYGAEGDLRKVDWADLPGAGGGISNVVEDTTPQLGGDLDLNGHVITGLVIGTNVQAYNAAYVKYDTEAQGPATGGVNITVKDLGNLSGNTITPNPGNRGIQKITNNGAGTIAPGSNYGTYLLEVINTTGAGAITLTGWTYPTGTFDTTTTSKFLCQAVVTPDFSLLNIQKLV